MNEQYSKPESKIKNISAIQWVADIESEFELKDFAGDNVIFDENPTPDYCTIITKDGPVKCDVGQWVVKGPDGNFHVATFES